MTIWIPYKAKANERRRSKSLHTKQRYCRSCGRIITSGALCPACMNKKRSKST